MATVQPEFKVNTQIQPVGVADVAAPYREIEQSLSEFSQFALSHSVQSLTALEAQRGKQAGAQKDYSPKGTPITPWGIAFRENAIQSHQAVINNDIRNKIQQLQFKWSTPTSKLNPDGGLTNNSFKNFQQDADAFAQGYFAQMPDAFKGTAQQVYANSLTQAQGKLLTQTSRLIQNNQKADISEALNKSQTESLNAAFTGDTQKAIDIFNQTDAHMQKLRDAGSISHALYDNTMVPYATKLKQELWLGQGRQAISNGKIEQFKSKLYKTKELQPLEIESVLKQVNSEIKLAVTESSAKDAALDDKMRQNLSNQLNKGDSENPTLMTEVEKTDPAQAASYKAASALMQDTSSLRDNIKYMNFGVAGKMLDAQKLDPKDPDLFFKQTQLQSLKAYNQNRQKVFKDDPAAYTENAPQVTAAMREAQLSPDFNSLPNHEQELRVKQAQVSAMVATQKAMGANPKDLSVLTTNDKDMLAGQFYGGNAQEKQSLINDMMATYGPHANIAGKDMAKMGIPQQTLNLANLDKLPKSRIQLPVIYEALDSPNIWRDLANTTDVKKSKKSDYITAAQSALKHILPTIGDSGQNGAHYRSNMVDLVARSAAAYVIKNGGQPAKAVQTMADAIYNNRYSAYGDHYRIPSGVSENTADAAMFAMKKNIDDTEFKPLNRLKTDIQLRPEDIKKQDMEVIKNGHWVSYGDDSGVYWVDGNGIPTKIKGTNKNYDILWKDLDTPGTPIQSMMQKHKRFFRKGSIAGSLGVIGKLF